MRTDFETLHVERVDDHVLLVMFDRRKGTDFRVVMGETWNFRVVQR